MRQAAHAIFHDHHRAVDDDAKIECAQAHQVGADVVGDHAGKREQHRQRNHHGGDDGGAYVPKKQEQDCNYQQRAFQQILPDRADCLVHKNGTVVDGVGDHALGQGPVDFRQPRGDCVRYRAAVLADQHEDGAKHDLVAILRSGPGAQVAADRHAGNIADPHRDATAAGDHNVANIGDGAQLPRRADQQLFPAFLDIAGADVAVVLIQGGDDFLH